VTLLRDLTDYCGYLFLGGLVGLARVYAQLKMHLRLIIVSRRTYKCRYEDLYLSEVNV
jgi:hypothetical protein